MQKRIITLIVSLVMLFSVLTLTACSEIENGSEVKRMTMTLDFCDASGAVVDTKDVNIKLFTTYAPKTTEHFISLCEQGFYDGLCISNIQSSWMEFGGYTYNANGEFVPSNYTGSTIKGEFVKNGHKWTGNKFLSQSGSIIMKRDYSSNNDADKKYDTAKSTVIITFDTVSTFDADEYCVFGAVCVDDADKNPASSDSASNSSSIVNRTGLSSLDILRTISALTTDEDGVRTYYYEKATDGNFFYTAKTEDGTTTYYKGLEMTESAEIQGDELTDFEKTLKDNANYFLTIPYTKVVIKSIK